MKKEIEILKYSDANDAQRKAYNYLGPNAILYYSPNKNKKFRIYDPNNDKWVDFGQMGYQDFTKHKNQLKRERYLKRATNIKGNWENNPYSPNNLSINILW